ncbi:glycosyltransferase [Metabacillus sp. FJAT-52054]|uniref:Glycosyltransferase n=1 Tax=Metabacillus sediminis TaxID=3117746 RepID=A0ABZ2NFW7_9BACI
MDNNVLVNATSLGSGGALTILNNYLQQLKNQVPEDKLYYIFVPDTCDYFSHPKIILIQNSRNPYYKSRNYWNLVGFKKWCIDKKVKPYEIYSMQNYFPFGFSEDRGVKKKLYLHQPIPFFEYEWSLFKKNERNLWFYKNIYIHLINKSIREADKVIVQTEWLKKKIVSKASINKDNVHVEKPILNTINPNLYTRIPDLEDTTTLFYPSSKNLYKNHKVLYKAMDIIVNKFNLKNVVLYLTLDKADDTALKYINQFNLGANIILTGELNYKQVMEHYKSVDALLFPSKIETYGLPLVEAQFFNLPIIASNLDLFKEVIGDYPRITFCGVDDEFDWANNIKGMIN